MPHKLHERALRLHIADSRALTVDDNPWTTREDARVAAGTAIGFTGYHDTPVDGAIAVATDSPWVLGRVSAPTRIATYGDSPGAMEALVAVLRGDAPAPGRLPVKVAGVGRAGC